MYFFYNLQIFHIFLSCCTPLPPFFKYLWGKQNLIYKTVRVSFTKYFFRQELPHFDRCVEIFRPILFRLKLLTPSLYMFINFLLFLRWEESYWALMESVVLGTKVEDFRRNILSAFLGGTMFIWNIVIRLSDHTIPKTPQDHNMYHHSYYFLFQITNKEVVWGTEFCILKLWGKRRP